MIGAIGALILLVCACSPAPGPSLPAGWVALGPASMAHAVLDRLALLGGSPIGDAARDARARVATCSHVEGQGDTAVALLGTLTCTTNATDELLLALPAQGDQRLVARGTANAQALDLRARLLPVAGAERKPRLTPARDPPPASRLAAADRAAWLHARFEDLDGALMAQGTQGADLFALDAQLLSRAVLDGAVEVAVYPPAEGGDFPRVVLALGVRGQSLGAAALDQLVERLHQRWQVVAEPWALNGVDGVCLPAVNILPSFSPCALLWEDAVLIGWNADSLRAALAPNGSTAQAASDKHRASMDFRVFREVDRLLVAKLAEGRPVAPQAYPWALVELSGSYDEEGLRMELRCSGEAP